MKKIIYIWILILLNSLIITSNANAQVTSELTDRIDPFICNASSSEKELIRQNAWKNYITLLKKPGNSQREKLSKDILYYVMKKIDSSENELSWASERYTFSSYYTSLVDHKLLWTFLINKDTKEIDVSVKIPGANKSTFSGPLIIFEDGKPFSKWEVLNNVWVFKKIQFKRWSVYEFVWDFSAPFSTWPIQLNIQVWCKEYGLNTFDRSLTQYYTDEIEVMRYDDYDKYFQEIYVYQSKENLENWKKHQNLEIWKFMAMYEKNIESFKVQLNYNTTQFFWDIIIYEDWRKIQTGKINTRNTWYPSKLAASEVVFKNISLKPFSTYTISWNIDVDFSWGILEDSSYWITWATFIPYLYIDQKEYKLNMFSVSYK